MKQDLIAKAEVDIAAPSDAVWAALVDPATVKQFMFGTDLVTDWRVGSPIRWSGEWQGKRYEDKGKVLEVDRGRSRRASTPRTTGG